MRYHALACDYDGTLALHGRVDVETVAALERLRRSGRHLLLVTGRELPDLVRVFPHLDLFERVVAENGALLYQPAAREERLLAEPAPQALVARLREKGVSPLSVGRSIVATWEPHQAAVLEAIHDSGLELHVIFNKGAVMVLPSGVNKATGLAAALEELGLSAHNVVGIGDAENDHTFLCRCECAVAVANALPSVKDEADLVTAGDHGTGVIELVDRLLASDLADVRLDRHDLIIGAEPDGTAVRVPPYGVNVLVAGASGSGKSTLATALLERLAAAGYQFCIIDPEGDYERLEGALALGDGRRSPGVDEVVADLAPPGRNVVVGLLGLAREHRPPFFESLLPRLHELRARTGRPHWIVVDETHHLLPSSRDPTAVSVPADLRGLLFITVHPDQLSPALLATVDLVFAVGDAAADTLRTFARPLDRPAPPVPPAPGEGHVLAWWPGERRPFWFRPERPHGERKRHLRKYAEGDLGTERSFYFRGPDGRLNLKAQNLLLFVQIAEGVDDETWLHHLRRGDYSRWFRDKIKDEALAEEAARIEAAHDGDPARSRAAIAEAVRERYTAPA